MVALSAKLIRTPDRPAASALADRTLTLGLTEAAAHKTASWKLPAITKWSAGP